MILIRYIIPLLALFLCASCNEGEKYKEVTDHTITMDEYNTSDTYYLRVIQTVNDYEKWKTEFDANADLRLQSGLRLDDIYRASENPNKIILMFQIENMDSATKYMSTPRLHESIKNAGVIDKPQITFLKVTDPVKYKMNR